MPEVARQLVKQRAKLKQENEDLLSVCVFYADAEKGEELGLVGELLKGRAGVTEQLDLGLLCRSLRKDCFWLGKRHWIVQNLHKTQDQTLWRTQVFMLIPFDCWCKDHGDMA